MRELINLIPFLDLIIVMLLVFFLYLGFQHGVPRFAMVIGAIYTGFLLASIYYHIFAVAFSTLLKIKSSFTADLVSFLVVDVLLTVLMLTLLVNLYGHVEIRGRVAVFDKVGGMLLGFFAGILVVGIFITLLRLPYEANKQHLNAASEMAVVQVFNQGYEKSALSHSLVKAAPFFLASMKPLLPAETREKGAVPLLESITAGQ